MFFLFSEIIFHFQIIIEESTYFKGEKKQGNERESKKEREKKWKWKRKKKFISFLKSSKRNTNNQFRFSEIIFRFVIIIEEQGYSKIK